MSVRAGASPVGCGGALGRCSIGGMRTFLARQRLLLLGLVAGLGLSVGGPPLLAAVQNAVIAPTDYVVWSQPGASLAAVQANRYTGRIDGGGARVFTPAEIRCTAATPPATGFDCGVQNPAPAVGSHTMALTYAIQFSSGSYSGESPAGTCAWDTGGTPTQPPSNFRFLRFIGGVFVKLWKTLTTAWG